MLISHYCVEQATSTYEITVYDQELNWQCLMGRASKTTLTCQLALINEIHWQFNGVQKIIQYVVQHIKVHQCIQIFLGTQSPDSLWIKVCGIFESAADINESCRQQFVILLFKTD